MCIEEGGEVWGWGQDGGEASVMYLKHSLICTFFMVSDWL